MRVLGILTYRVEGAERLREPGRLIVANHPTLLDVVLLVSLMPAVDCIVKRGLWRNPFLRWPVSWAGYLPNSEGEVLVKNARRRCGAVTRCWSFPKARAPCPASRCACSAAPRTSRSLPTSQILPVTIACDPPTLFKGNPWYRVPARRFHLHVVVGTPIAARDFAAKTKRRRAPRVASRGG